MAHPRDKKCNILAIAVYSDIWHEWFLALPTPTYPMTTKTSRAIAATRQKILAQIATAQKQADAAKKTAKTAKTGFKLAKQKFKEARRAAKTAKKAVKMLKIALAVSAGAKVRSKRPAPKAAVKRSRPAAPRPVTVREPAVTVAPAATESTLPVVSMT